MEGEGRVVQCPSCRFESTTLSSLLKQLFLMKYFFQLSNFREILSLVLPSVTSPVFKQFLEKQVN